MSETDYIFVHLIDRDTEPSTFIPLHMTALHWFQSDKQPVELAALLEKFTSDRQAVHTLAIEEAMFGPDKNIPVVRLERTPQLLDIHLDLLALVDSIGGRLDKRWTGEERWNPHVTHRPEARLQVGDEVIIDDISLFMRSRDGRRQLIATSAFGGSDA